MNYPIPPYPLLQGGVTTSSKSSYLFSKKEKKVSQKESVRGIATSSRYIIKESLSGNINPSILKKFNPPSPLCKGGTEGEFGLILNIKLPSWKKTESHSTKEKGIRNRITLPLLQGGVITSSKSSYLFSKKKKKVSQKESVRGIATSSRYIIKESLSGNINPSILKKFNPPSPLCKGGDKRSSHTPPWRRGLGD